jgi:TolA-binding protein
MNKILNLIPVFIAVALVITLFYGYSEYSSLKTAFHTANNNLITVTSELKIKNNIIGELERQIQEQEQQLTQNANDIEQLNEIIASRDDDITQANDEISEANQEIKELNTVVERYEEILDGMGISLYETVICRDAELIDNPNAKIPTYDELITFLAIDQTENHEYVEDEYDCTEFSRDFHNNAEQYGIKCAVVHVSFSNLFFYGHALNAVLTSDYGWIYIDVTESPDTIAFVKSGEEYRSIGLEYININNIKNQDWWLGLLDNYYYIPSSVFYQTPSGIFLRKPAIVNNIKIYW